MHPFLEKDVFETKDILKQWFIPTASILFKKNDNLVFPDWFTRCASGDIPLLLLLSLQGKLKFLPDNMGVYRHHDAGISTKHTGYFKVFSMVYIYQNFNDYTNKKFEGEIFEAMKYEVRMHLPEMVELRKLKQKRKKRILSSLYEKICKKLTFK
ncbi:hypothetical protein LZ575_08535 [Antarcticibacterium sp. 1MA-6-2]|uniref:hypothetical protein n=1 Tax=Antarcticibacterium sp. 1MA-6-2 TaxID=2908210 RepID=UPI001F2830EF|nr:hypothetical protein [Antarcticibacterium sp. 1MA-6-2]UJH92519.1 hypothetical protein LZ575_08535 [Antarcticibacterium sp. 1MA-6-2]